MTITKKYRIHAAFYRAHEKHDVLMEMREYICEDSALIHIRIGDNICVRLGSGIEDEFRGQASVPMELYLFQNTCNDGKVNTVSRHVFEKKLRRFDITKTAVVKEFLEAYSYTGKDRGNNEVHITIVEKDGQMTAVIDFSDDKQYKNFVAPDWLLDDTSLAAVEA